MSAEMRTEMERRIFPTWLVLRHVCRKTVLEGTEFEAADVTDDDEVDIQDLRKILRFVCRKITEL